MKSLLASMALVFAFCAAEAAAAEFPKTGEAEYDTYYVYRTAAKIDSGAGMGLIVDVTGITRNVKGEGPFHDMSVRCVGHQSVVGDTQDFNGSCVETDKDGDNVFTTFDTQNHYLKGGTGKYKGITGTIPYTVTTPARHRRRPRGSHRQPQGHLGNQVDRKRRIMGAPLKGRPFALRLSCQGVPWRLPLRSVV